MWLFVGVALASDLFVDGITQITSTKRRVRRQNERGEWVEVEEPVWNWVVANITLMALGTSAPEILLATVEALLTLGKPAGQLGPACIVGSAAYNFLIITAVCTVVIPTGEFKRVAQLRVYITTAAWSIFAYIWMLVCLSWWTPNVITIVEALLTLLFFVLLIVSAYLVDTQPWKRRRFRKLAPAPTEGAGDVEGADRRASDQDQAARTGIVAYQGPGPLPLPPRTSSMRAPGTGPDALDDSPAVGVRKQAAASHLRDLQARVRAIREPHLAQVCFRSSAYSALASSGMARVTVLRSGGNRSLPLQVNYETQDGDAIAGLDYKATHGTIDFIPGEEARALDVQILEDDASEPDVSFWMVLRTSTSSRCPYVITQERVRITIVDDDVAGSFSFEVPTVEAVFRPWQPWVEVTVVRRGGQDGQVQVSYCTDDDSALAGRDYVASSGVLTFDSGEKTQCIRIPLMPSTFTAGDGAVGPLTTVRPVSESVVGTLPGPRDFRVRLEAPTGGAQLGFRTVTTVTLSPAYAEHLEEDEQGAAVARIKRLEFSTTSSIRKLEGAGGKAGGAGDVNAVVARPQSSSDGSAKSEEFDLWTAYKAQILAAFSMPVPEDSEEQPKVSQCLLHFGSIFFKVVLAMMVPPAEWRGGYPCFFAALSAVIGLVYVLEQAANLLGCITGLSEFAVGISLVAVGTSLPDTFASMMAAREEDTADAAVGNITGSNCVNVFLGLGLPWLISSVYQAARGTTFEAPAGDLAFSVAIFAGVFGIAITIQFFRRYQGGELGGSIIGKTAVAATFVLLWLVYLILSGLRSTGKL